MGYFAKEMPLKPDLSIGPVIIGSKIRVEGGTELLPLEGGNVEIIPGCSWDQNTARVTKELTPEKTRLRITVSLPAEVTLSHYVGCILKKKPIKLKVTLFPRMLAPGMGLPVNVAAAPVTDEVDVTMPAVPEPEIALDAQFTGKSPDGSYQVRVTATLDLPPYISRAEKTEVMDRLTIDTTDEVNARVTKGAMVPFGEGKELELSVVPDGTVKDGTASVMVTSAVSLSGMPLKATRKVTIEFEKKYILNIHPGSIAVSMKTPGSLVAQVLEEMTDGQKVLLTDAMIGLSGGEGVLILSPDKGSGRLASSVLQQKVSDTKNISINVSATAGNAQVPPQVISVSPETAATGRLEVVFEPASKTSLNPFIKSDHVVLKARVLPEKEGEPPDADIIFVPGDLGGWLDGPRDSGTPGGPGETTAAPTSDISLPASGTGGEWKTASFFGRNPGGDTGSAPPASEQVTVRATLRGVLIDELTVPVGLLSRPGLKADKEVLIFLANAKKGRDGRPAAATSDTLTMTVTDPAGEDWKVTISGESDLVGIKETSHEPSVSTFEVTPKEEIPLPQAPGKGAPPWEQVIMLSSSAKAGDGSTVEGPEIAVTFLHEGIYVESMFEFDKTGARHQVLDRDWITFPVFSPGEERAMPEHVDVMRQEMAFPYVTFAVMVWDGTTLVKNEDLNVEVERDPGSKSIAQRSKDTSRAGYIWDFIFFTMRESVLEVMRTTDNYMKNTGKWHVVLFKQIPGNGEHANGLIRFLVDPPNYYYFGDPEGTKNWQYELPIHLVLGDSGELNKKGDLNYLVEGARCRKVIEQCYPLNYQDALWRELDALPCKGAKDYHEFSKLLYARAHEIWKIEEQDYLVAETAWSALINVSGKAEFAGDLAFNALVMYYSRTLPPVANFAITNIVSTIKSESLAVYAYYVGCGQKPDLPTCINAYVEENWVRFLRDLANGAIVEPYLLREFNIAKVAEDPGKYGKILAWLWLWKFQMHLAEGIGKDDGGIINAAYQATTDLGSLALVMILSDFVGAHANADLRSLYGQVRDQGFFGGTRIPGGQGKTEKDGAGKPEETTGIKKGKKEAAPGEKPGETEKGTKKEPGTKTEKEKAGEAFGGEKKPAGNRTPEEKARFGEGSGKPISDAKFAEAGTNPDLNGISDFHLKALEKIAKEMDVIPIMRPFGDQYGHLANGEAYPKITMIHEKTINPIDREYLGFGGKDSDTGFAACKKMPETLERPPGMSDKEWGKVRDRYEQRKKEYDSFSEHLAELEKQGKVDWDRKTGIIYAKNRDGSRGKPFSGDNDPFAYIDAKTGLPLSPEKSRQFADRLHQVGITMHPDHISWDYTSAHEHAANTRIDDAILKGHSQGGTPLNRYNPRTGKWDTVWWGGGLRK